MASDFRLSVEHEDYRKRRLHSLREIVHQRQWHAGLLPNDFHRGHRDGKLHRRLQEASGRPATKVKDSISSIDRKLQNGRSLDYRAGSIPPSNSVAATFPAAKARDEI